MDESKAARGGCRWIRYIGVLFQTIQAIACTLWATLLKPSDSPRRLLGHQPHTPVLPPDANTEGQSTSSCRIETMDHLEVVSELSEGKTNCGFIPAHRNEDLGLGSTEASGVEQPPACYLESKNSEIVTEPEANRILKYHTVQALPQRVHASGYTIPPGFEKSQTWSERTIIANSDDVSQPDDLTLGITTSELPVERTPKSTSPTISSLESEQVSSSCSETTDSEIFSEPEVIRDVIRLARTADLVSGAEVERGLHQSLFSSRSFSDILSESERKCDSIDRLCKAVSGSRVLSAPNLKFITNRSGSDSSDFDILSDPDSEGSRTAALPSGADGARDLEETEISLSYSDTTDSDVVSEPDKQLGSRCDTTESGTVAAIPSTGTLEAAESELRVREEGNKGSEGVAAEGTLNPNAKDYIPGAASKGAWDFQVHSGPQQSVLRQRLKLGGPEQLSLSWIEEKSYQPSSAPGSSASLDLGTALRMNYEIVDNWTKWSHGPSISRSNSEVVWGSGQKKASTDRIVSPPRPGQDLKLASGNKSKTTSRQRRDRRPGRRPYYYPSTSVRKAKASCPDIKT